MKTRGFLVAALLVGCGSFSAADPTETSPVDAAAPSRPRSCEGAVLASDDFSGASISRDWRVEGAPVLDPAEGLPAPSLRATTAARTDGEEKNRIVRTIQDARTRLCIELDLRVEADPSIYAAGSYTEILTLLPEKVFVEVRPGGLVLAVSTEASPLLAFKFGEWNHVVVRVDYGASSVEVEIDGARVARQVGTSAPPSIDVLLGAYTTNVAGAATVHADNFAITAP